MNPQNTDHQNMQYHLLFFLVFLFLAKTLTAQEFGENRKRFQIRAERIKDPMAIDGSLNERTWEMAAVAGDFFRVLPIDSGQAISQTEVRVAYDDDFLYMAITCMDTFAGKRPAESLRRDFSFGKNDNFLVFMDTYNDQTNGFSFGTSAAGAQWDGLQANGGFVSLDWDCKWRSAVQNYSDKWIAEYAIPFRSIRYQNGVREWGINFSRLDLKSAEKSSWAPVPRQFQTANLAFTGTLVFDEAPPSLGTRFSLIPYVSGRSSRQSTDLRARGDFDAGLDAKVTLSTSLNLDLTVNPDFSQVEVDEQVTNLDRFELFFPERRQFFLENSDLFASLGSPTIRPFFSRRIGLNSPVRAGLRLSGKIGDDMRIGLMNIQTGPGDEISPANFTVAAVQQQVFERSNLGVFFVNKSLTDETVNGGGDQFNRVFGIDYNLASADSRWTGKIFYHHSFAPSDQGRGFASAAEITYSDQRFSATLNQQLVDQNYQAKVGFVRRKGYYLIDPSVTYKFFPKESIIANHGPSVQVQMFHDRNFRLSDRQLSLAYNFQFIDRSNMGLALTNTFLRLLDPFDPTNTGALLLSEGSEYRWTDFSAFFSSNARSIFNFRVLTQIGDYFDGGRFGLDVETNYRVQPFGSIGLRSSFNRINLLQLDDPINLLLIGPKLDITFTDKIFLTGYLQYNDQIDNVNLNIRFQWRYKPVSDFFIVYSSNHFSDSFSYKNRAIVAKLSYYFN